MSCPKIGKPGGHDSIACKVHRLHRPCHYPGQDERGNCIYAAIREPVSTASYSAGLLKLYSHRPNWRNQSFHADEDHLPSDAAIKSPTLRHEKFALICAIKVVAHSPHDVPQSDFVRLILIAKLSR